MPHIVSLADRRSAASSGASATVDQPGYHYVEMARNWVPIHDLLGSTYGMRASGIRNLPKFKKEKPTEYRGRLDTSFLFQFFEDAVDWLVSRPYQRPVTFTTDLDDWMEPVVRNVDRKGMSFQEYMHSSFWDGVVYGIAHTVVDYSVLPMLGELSEPRMAFEVEREGGRPIIRRIDPTDLIGWRHIYNDDGTMRLVQARVYEERVEDIGDFGEVLTEVVTVYSEDFIQEWRKAPGNDESFQPMQPRANPLGKVPLVTWYTKRTGLLTAKPPLLECAWLNIDHWQSYSDQRQILHTGRVPILFQAGFKESEIRPGGGTRAIGWEIGAKRAIRTTSSAQEADMKYVEPEGAAMTHGEAHLRLVSERCQSKGRDPANTLGPATATGEVRVDMRATPDLHRWAMAQEVAANEVWELASEWQANTNLPNGFRVKVFTDFDLRSKSEANMKLIQADRARGDIGPQTYLREAVRHGVYDEDLDIDAEIAMARTNPPPGMLMETEGATDESDDGEG